MMQKGPDLGRLYVDELRQRFHVIPVPHEMRLRIIECSCQDAVNDVDGHGLLADVEGSKYIESEPGIGIAAAEWLVKANLILIGSDNMGIEVVPHADKDLLFPVHQIIITTHGIFLLENLNLDGLARDKTSELASVVLPLKIKGGTGSTVAPIAIK